MFINLSHCLLFSDTTSRVVTTGTTITSTNRYSLQWLPPSAAPSYSANTSNIATTTATSSQPRTRTRASPSGAYISRFRFLQRRKSRQRTIRPARSMVYLSGCLYYNFRPWRCTRSSLSSRGT